MTQPGLWIIGYGSLIFKPPPLYALRVTGKISGFVRRFWQSSSDHRGTPQSPGRVVTLVPLDDIKQDKQFQKDIYAFEFRNEKHSKSIDLLTEDDLAVWGVAYYIEAKNVDEVKAYMDVREQDGYSTHLVHFEIHDVPIDNSVLHEALSQAPQDSVGVRRIESTVYIGTIQNLSFVGPEEISATAKVIRTSKGPSGQNIEYLKLLTEAVRLLSKDEGSGDVYLEELLELAEGNCL